MLAPLTQLLLLTLLAVLVALLLSRFRLPAIAALLAAGALVGPYGIGLVRDSHDLLLFAETGVFLLLFSIGLEFTAQRLSAVGGRAMLSGVLQVVLTTAAVALIALALGSPLATALVYGLAAALSSTAIVLRSLEERGEVDAPHGRLVLATLIVQDLLFVPMLMLLPVLAGGSAAAGGTTGLLLLLLKAVGLVAIALLAARFLVPPLMHMVDAARSREIFALALLALCLSLAWLSTAAGLSLALGGFLAGIMLANSDFAQRALSEVLPIRSVLVSFFFISLGMLFDWRQLLERPLPLLGILLLLLIGKGLIATFSVLLLRFPARVALLFGFGLAQFGEFGYVLLSAAGQTVPPLVPQEQQPLLLSAGLLSMLATPFLIKLAPRLAAGERLLRPLERLLGLRGIDEPEAVDATLAGHIVLAGYGHAGQEVGAALQASGQPYIVLELNSATVRARRAAGEPVYYADVTSAEALEHARLREAKALVVMINDQHAVARAVSAARQVHPGLPVVVRARYVSQRAALEALGATLVIVEEQESAREIVTQLRALLTPSPSLASRG